MRAIALLALLCSSFGCGSSSQKNAAPVTARTASKPVSTSSTTRAASDVAKLAAGDDAFAGRLYAQLARTNGTFAYSPFSISQALAMTAAGARGATLTQLEHALSFALPPSRVAKAFKQLDGALAARQRSGVRLSIANSLWGQSGLKFETPFLGTLSGDYGAPLRRTDFKADPDGARKTINAWVAQHTANRILNLFPPNSITRQSSLVLANAVYLNARWESPFERSDTADGTFHAPAGDRKVPFMHQTELLRTARGNGFRSLELPYRGGRLALDVVLPDKGGLGRVERRVASHGLLGLLAHMRSQRIDLALPKVKLQSQFELAGPLAALGARDLFTDRADLSGMSRQTALKVSRVLHKAVLAIDERGTVAAAATGVVIEPTAIQVPAGLAVNVNRPFLLAVRDRATGSLLFVARVLDPAGT